MLDECIEQLEQGKNLSSEQAKAAINAILSDAEDMDTIAHFLILLHKKGETSEEMQGIIEAMRAVMKTVNIEGDILDVVGTGGDNANTVNISTASALLAAACGARVVKHGNRSVSSKCGSADVLEALGFSLEASPEEVIDAVNQRHFAFCFAPNFHPAMKKVKEIRESLGVRTTFNLLGPLLNPANANCYLMGVFSEDYLDLFANTLLKLNVKHAMVVHSCGLDELTLLGPSTVVEIKNGKKKRYVIDPKEFGFEKCTLKDIQGGAVAQNAELLKAALSGKPGPITDTILLNTGAALYVAGISKDIKSGIHLAREKMKSGAALKLIG